MEEEIGWQQEAEEDAGENDEEHESVSVTTAFYSVNKIGPAILYSICVSHSWPSQKKWAISMCMAKETHFLYLLCMWKDYGVWAQSAFSQTSQRRDCQEGKSEHQQDQRVAIPW